MLLTNPLILSQLPLMAQTLGASSVIFAPIFNLLLIAAAILLVIAILRSEFVRNIFAGLGFLGLMNYLFSSNQPSSSRPQQIDVYSHPAQAARVAYAPPIHPHSSMFTPTPNHHRTYSHISSSPHNADNVHIHCTQTNRTFPDPIHAHSSRSIGIFSPVSRDVQTHPSVSPGSRREFHSHH